MVLGMWPMTNKDLGQRIRARREYLGLTQADIAEQFNVAKVTVSQYESGKRGLDAAELPRLAKILKVPASYFYGEEAYDETQDGILPQIIAFYDDLNDDGKDDLVALAKSVWERKRKQEPVIGRKAETEEEEKERL